MASVYHDPGAYVSAGARVDVDVTERLTLSVGAHDRFDRSYVLPDGIAEPGSSMFVGMRVRY